MSAPFYLKLRSFWIFRIHLSFLALFFICLINGRIHVYIPVFVNGTSKIIAILEYLISTDLVCCNFNDYPSTTEYNQAIWYVFLFHVGVLRDESYLALWLVVLFVHTIRGCGGTGVGFVKRTRKGGGVVYVFVARKNQFSLRHFHYCF